MSEQIRTIVEALNKPPFSKNFNLITFDSLDGTQLLQCLNDLISTIDPKQSIDIRQEDAGQTAVRNMQLLQLLRYHPPGADSPESLQAFRQGLVLGEKQHIYPLMEWLIQNMADLKVRAYLGNYLRKIEVPLELLQDDELANLNAEYEAALDEFKEVHSQFDELKKAGESTQEIRADIENMETEKEQAARRVERLKAKASNHRAGADGVGKLLELAQAVRSERDRETQINQQKSTLRSAMTHLEQRVHRTKQQLSEVRQANAGAGPQRLLEKLEHSVAANAALAENDLPKEVALGKRKLRSLQQMVNEPAVGASDVGAYRTRVAEATTELNRLVEQRMTADSQEQQLSVFRQQAAVVSGKRENVASRLLELRHEAQSLHQELQAKSHQANVNHGDNVPQRSEAPSHEMKFVGKTEDDLRAYAGKLKVKKSEFQQKRAIVHEQMAEIGILNRTVEILKQRDEDAGNQLARIEASKGVAGARATQDRLENVSSKKAGIDENKGKALEDMADLVKRLNARIAEKKQALAPLLKEVRPLRQTVQELSALHGERKTGYDNAAASAAGNYGKLENDVNRLRDQLMNEQSRYYQIMGAISQIEINQQRVADEMHHLVSADPQEKRKSFKEVLSKRLAEGEQLGRLLREQQHELAGTGGELAVKQVRLWREVMRLVEAKVRTSPLNNNANQAKSSGGAGPNTLVI